MPKKPNAPKMYRLKRHQSPPPITDREKEALASGAKIIPLTKNQWAIVDAEDYEVLSKCNWTALEPSKGKFYAARYANTSLMHRVIMDNPEGEVDHRNLDSIDNRRKNLRVATHAENNRNKPLQSNNKSGLKGVHFNKRRNKWVAQIKYQGRQISLGRYSDKEAAHAAFLREATRLHGEFYRLR